MWDILKYLLIITVIAYTVTWYFGEGTEQRRKEEFNLAIKKFIEAENRHPNSIEDLERRGYIDRFTNRDRAPVNGEWCVDEDRGKCYIFRYTLDDHGRPKRDEDGTIMGTREY